MMKNPDGLFYTNEHLWVGKNGSEWQAGITDYAQDLLGDIVFIDPPKVGTLLVRGQACGLVESVKTGSDLHAPMNGVVTEVNDKLLNAPETINDQPYKAWIFKFVPAQADEMAHFLTAQAYADITQV